MEPHSNDYLTRYITFRKPIPLCKTPFCKTLFEDSEDILSKRLGLDSCRRPQSSFKTASNRISAPSMSKPTAGSGWRDIVITVESPLRSGARRAVADKIVQALGRAVGNQDAGKPISSSANSRAEDDGDVTYLYTVDSSSSGCIVPEIDLSQESETTSFPREISNDVKPTSMKGLKRKLTGTASPRKRCNNEVVFQCQNCKLSYSLTANVMKMFLASCGHLICKACSLAVSTKRCPCGKKVHVLRKLYR